MMTSSGSRTGLSLVSSILWRVLPSESCCIIYPGTLRSKQCSLFGFNSLPSVYVPCPVTPLLFLSCTARGSVAVYRSCDLSPYLYSLSFLTYRARKSPTSMFSSLSLLMLLNLVLSPLPRVRNPQSKWTCRTWALEPLTVSGWGCNYECDGRGLYCSSHDVSAFSFVHLCLPSSLPLVLPCCWLLASAVFY
jgi:hypothetical protein